jgi:hypothetical protein
MENIIFFLPGLLFNEYKKLKIKIFQPGCFAKMVTPDLGNYLGKNLGNIIFN